MLFHTQRINKSCILTVLLLEHSPQFGNFAEVDPPPLLILGHDHVRFTCRNSINTSDMLFCIKFCIPAAALVLDQLAVPLWGMLTGTISWASTPASYAALLRL